MNSNWIFFFREEEEEIKRNMRSQFVRFTGCTITEIKISFFSKKNSQQTFSGPKICIYLIFLCNFIPDVINKRLLVTQEENWTRVGTSNHI